MAFVTLARTVSHDGSLDAKVLRFLKKLQEDDTRPGLNIEPIKNSADESVRTGRVDQSWRAVVFKRVLNGAPHYIYYGTYPHDEAIEKAKTTVLRYNLKLGAPEFAQEKPRKEAYEYTPPAEPAQPEEPATVQPASSDAQVADPGWENRVAANWDLEGLEDIGIDPEYGSLALAATTQSAFQKAVEAAPVTQGLVLLGLSVGDSIDDIREDLGLQPAEEATEEILREGMARQPHVFADAGDDPDKLEAAFATSDIDQWRTFLHPEQQRYATGSWNGPYRVSGGAGTGKTVVLLHRANHLARREPEARILLTTFTRALADSLETNMRKLAPDLGRVSLGEKGLAILGIDQVAYGVISAASPEELAAATDKVLGWTARELNVLTKVDAAFSDAVAIAHPDLDPELCSPGFLEQEYTSVVLGNGITSSSQYARVSRAGRGTSLGRKQRLQAWKVFAQFRRSNEYEQRATFPEISAVAAQVLESRAENENTYLCDHVLIDEGQDFHAAHWKLIRALVAPGRDDIFIGEDSHQRIYGQKATLSRYGIEVRGRARRLRLNYRTTAENLAYAISILSGRDYTDIEGEDERSSDYRSLRSGPRPIIEKAANIDEENEIIVKHVRAWTEDGVQPEAIGVLSRTRDRINSLKTALSEAGISSVSDEGGAKTGSGSVCVMTMHKAKGMEFQCVIVAGIGADQIPAQWALEGLPAAERDDALQRENSLLYVAATRARDELVLTRVG